MFEGKKAASWLPFAFSLSAYLLTNLFGLSTSLSLAADPTIQIQRGLGRDHAELEPDQAVELQQFVKDRFLDGNGNLSLTKVKAFEAELKGKRAKLTEVLEKSVEFEQILADVRKRKKSKRFAQEHRMNVNRTLETYNGYIIPSIELLRRSLEERKPKEQSQAYLDDFLRGYHLFRAVGIHVSPWLRNNDVKNIIKHTVSPWVFKKDQPNAYEAINLLVDEGNVAELRQCLGAGLKSWHYLTKKEIQKLISCRYDISKINPGVSPLWTQTTSESRQKYIQYIEQGRHFPTDGIPLYFNEVMLTSNASPKVQVKADFGNGLIRKYKLKWGREAHTDPAASYLGQLVGFNSDTIKYYPKIRFYLGKVTYEKFESALQAKWGLTTVDYTVFSYGSDPQYGNYIEIQDAILEARPEDLELRIGGFDPTVMDFLDRREFRGNLLFNSWINLVDVKIANMKYLLAKTEPAPGDSRSRILMRMKDMGFAFGPSMFWMKPWEVYHLTFLSGNHLPNEMEREGVVTLKKGDKPDQTDQVTIRWNDLQMLKGIFKNTTYYDLKWMARKIVELTPEQIEWAMLTGGSPAEIARLYRHILISRRNEIVRTFRLQEDGIAEYPVPDLKNWSPQQEGIPSEPVHEGDQKPGIKDGKVVKTHFKGKQVYLRNKNTLAYYTVQVLNSVIAKVLGQVTTTGHKFTFNDKNQLSAVAAPVADGTKSGVNFDRKMVSKPIKLNLGVGVSATLIRAVRQSPHDFHNDLDNAARPYVIHDVLTISMGVGSPLAKKITQMFPVQIDLSAQILQATFEMVHYHETFAGSYITSPLYFLESLVRPVEYSVEKLKRMEMIRRSLSVGVQATAAVHAFDFEPLVVNRAGLNGGLSKMYDEAFFVDRFGELHFYTQDTSDKNGQIDMILLQLLNIRTPFVNYLNSKKIWNTTQRDFQTQRNDSASIEAPLNRSSEASKKIQSDLVVIRDYSKKDPLPEGENLSMGMDFQLESKGKIKIKNRNILGRGKASQKISSSTEMVNQSGKRDSVILSQSQVNEYIGMLSKDTHIPFRDLTVKKSQRVRLNIEIDNFDPVNKFGILLKVLDFDRYMNRAELDRFILDLNRRFSKDSSKPFYSGEFELPDVKEVNEYRKVYAMSYIILNGTEFLEKLMSIKRDELELRIRRFKAKVDSSNVLAEIKERISMHFDVKNLLEDYDEIRKSYQKLGNLRVLQAMNGKKDPEVIKSVYQELSEKLDRFFSHLEMHIYGVQFLKELVDEKSILVMGAIEGVLPSYSTLQSLQERQQCRYIADGGWGKWNGHLPVLYLNRYGRYAYKSVLLGNHVSLDEIFGILESTMPEELKPATLF